MLSTDQLGNTIEFNFPPQKIISLVPSQTEFLFDIGLDEQIVGLTRYCIHPAEKVKAKENIGGTKRFNLEKIQSLHPDLIIGNKEENYLTGIEKLKEHFPVWMSDIYTLDDVYAMMKEVAKITDRPAQGEAIVVKVQNSFKELSDELLATRVKGDLTGAYFIWRKPYMVAASNTYIDYMMRIFGLKNVFSSLQRYPEIESGMLSILKPDFIFLSSEPYSFSEKHFAEFQSSCPTSKVVLVDGEMFSCNGSRLILVPEYFKKLRWQIQGKC